MRCRGLVQVARFSIVSPRFVLSRSPPPLASCVVVNLFTLAALRCHSKFIVVRDVSARASFFYFLFVCCMRVVLQESALCESFTERKKVRHFATMCAHASERASERARPRARLSSVFRVCCRVPRSRGVSKYRRGV